MQKTFHFHINPPQKGAPKVSFSGVVEENTNLLSIGLSKCSKNDQFDRKKGRLISTGRAIKSPVMRIDVSNIAERDVCDTFVQQCKDYANRHNFYTEYQRKKKNKKQNEDTIMVFA